MQEVLIQYRCDVTGEVLPDGGERILFTYAGQEYRTDLCAKVAAAFHEQLRYYAERAYKLKPERRSKPKTAKAGEQNARAAKVDTAVDASDAQSRPGTQSQVRAWAKANGFVVAGKGHISNEVWDHFVAAQKRPA